MFRQLGVPEIEGVLTEFGSLIPAPKAGRFDVIAAGMYVTPARCREILFSDPTYAVGEAFAVPAGNPLDLHGYDDLRDTEAATLGVVTGTIQLRYARAVGIDDERIVVFPDAPSAIDGVTAGRVSAYGLVLAATNMPWDVDPAMKRPGRFARQVFVPPPDEAARSEMLREKLRDVPTEDVDVALLTSRTEHFSGADIDGLI